MTTETHYAVKIITAEREYLLCRPGTGHVALLPDHKTAKRYFCPNDVEGVVRHQVVKVNVTIEEVTK